MLRRPAASPGRLPDFVVVGCFKGGTTSLNHYLARHPQIRMADPKEPRYFVEAHQNGNWHRGEAWYRGHFRTSQRLCGEASPSYSQWPSIGGVMERMAALVPRAKLIYLVREPWSRLGSHYLMEVRTGRSELGLAEHLRARPDLLDASCYGTQMRHFLEFYPRAQVLVLESAELLHDTATALDTICAFLGVDNGIPPEVWRQRYHESAREGHASLWGRRILRSAGYRSLTGRLPARVTYQLRLAVLRLFRGEPPSLELPAEFRATIQERFQAEAALLRSLTGQALPSIEPRPLGALDGRGPASNGSSDACDRPEVGTRPVRTARSPGR